MAFESKKRMSSDQDSLLLKFKEPPSPRTPPKKKQQAHACGLFLERDGTRRIKGLSGGGGGYMYSIDIRTGWLHLHLLLQDTGHL